MDIIQGVDFEKYGFVKTGDKLIFSVYKATQNKDWRTFIKASFEDFVKCYYKAMSLDAELPRDRKRKLSTFLKSIYDQTNPLVALVMIKAVSKFIDEGKEEADIVSTVVRSTLPDAGFSKSLIDGKYVWKIDDKKKFKHSIGKAFVLNYINNSFDKDSVWKWLKKHCYQNADGMWQYKSQNSKQKLINIVKSFIKDGGILVEENINKDFNAFVPLKVLNKDLSGSDRFVMTKEVDGVKNYYVTGVAANTSVDRDEERIGENFIAKMKEQAKGLPLLANSHYAKEMDDTIGVVEQTSGDKTTFEIVAKLEDPEMNPNVKKFLSKAQLGVNYGFSVGGRITKAFREYNKDLDKEIVVLADGGLHHVLLTNQPANPETFAEAIAKSLNKDCLEGEGAKEGKRSLEKIYSVKHRSALHKNEPSIEEVMKSVSELPDTAFPINHKEKKVCKDYAHHFEENGELYLHKSLLVKAYKKAVEENADKFVINHLQNHLYTIGLSKMIDEIEGIKSSVENLEEVESLTKEIASELKELFKSVQSVKKLGASKVEKVDMLKSVIADVSQNIYKSIEKINVE
jgi:hypothetical protein